MAETSKSEKFGLLVYAGYLLIGAVQWIATISGLKVLFGIPSSIGCILSLLIGYVPVVGTISGIIGAYKGWGWSLPTAIALFVVPTVFVFALGIWVSVNEKS